MPGGEHENMQAWSPEEDTIILEMHSQLGPLWSQIVRQLPGRTVSSVRNRWQRIAMLGGSANRENATRTVSFAPMAWRSEAAHDHARLLQCFAFSEVVTVRASSRQKAVLRLRRAQRSIQGADVFRTDRGLAGEQPVRRLELGKVGPRHGEGAVPPAELLRAARHRRPRAESLRTEAADTLPARGHEKSGDGKI